MMTPLRAARPLWALVLSRFLTVIFPVLAVLIAVRVIMSPLFLQLEYNRPGFPDDPFGLTREDRLTYAPYALDYLLYGKDITYLGDLRFSDGETLYTVRELQHMRDVQTVTQAAYALAVLSGVLAAIAGVTMVRIPAARESLIFGLRNGALLTILLLFTIVILVVGSWDFFFTTFHQIFFASGTWVFYTSDTLIRLFPEQFWFDAAITIGVLSALISLIVLLIISRVRASRPLP
ncbi:MAG: TIGR01906 family membrane protein [Anaerolineae bacterium]